MSLTLPHKIHNPEGISQAGLDDRLMQERLSAFMETDDLLTHFVRNEVNLVGAYADELIVPGDTDPTTVFLGKMFRYSQEENLWVRFGKPKRVVYRYIALSKNMGVNSWYFTSLFTEGRIHDRRKGFLCLEQSPQSKLDLPDILEAARLATEFSAALRSYHRNS